MSSLIPLIFFLFICFKTLFPRRKLMFHEIVLEKLDKILEMSQTSLFLQVLNHLVSIYNVHYWAFPEII